MRTEIDVYDLVDSVEAEFFLKDLRKLREKYIAGFSKDFKIIIHGEINV